MNSLGLRFGHRQMGLVAMLAALLVLSLPAHAGHATRRDSTAHARQRQNHAGVDTLRGFTPADGRLARLPRAAARAEERLAQRYEGEASGAVASPVPHSGRSQPARRERGRPSRSWWQRLRRSVRWEPFSGLHLGQTAAQGKDKPFWAITKVVIVIAFGIGLAIVGRYLSGVSDSFIYAFLSPIGFVIAGAAFIVLILVVYDIIQTAIEKKRKERLKRMRENQQKQKQDQKPKEEERKEPETLKEKMKRELEEERRREYERQQGGQPERKSEPEPEPEPKSPAEEQPRRRDPARSEDRDPREAPPEPRRMEPDEQ
jgi:hypothetical protein